MLSKISRINYNTLRAKRKSRDEIALEFGKSQGITSNIISTFRNNMTIYDIDSMKDR
jgi:hypothetical protein